MEMVQEAGTRRSGLLWKRVLGSTLGLVALAWLASYQDMAQMWRAVLHVDAVLLILSMPIIFANMFLRSFRWRLLLGSRDATKFSSVFSALMIGYLANNILPVRAGDLVRVYVLSNDEQSMSWSRILATVFLERVLDMAAVVLVFSLVAFVSPLPDWVRNGALFLGAATAVCLVLLIVIGLAGERSARFLLLPFKTRALRIVQMVQDRARDFAVGLGCVRRPLVGVGFFLTTAAIWILEIVLIVLIAQAFELVLNPLDAAVLMLFSLFSNLIPALPGQFGIFELAMITGLKFLGVDSPASLPFALALHFLLIVGTSLLGAMCLLYRGVPLMSVLEGNRRK